MSILSLVEDRPTPKAVYNWRIYLLAAVASSISCMIGYDSAFIGGTIALTSFRDEFSFAEMSASKQNLISANIVSLYQAGAFFGSFFAYPIGHFFGRKVALIVAAFVFILGSGLMLGANGARGLGLIYAGRVLAGIGVGAGSNITPIYISELAPPAIRGRLVGIYELGWQVGGLVGFWINVRILTNLALMYRRKLIRNLHIVRCIRTSAYQPQAMADSLCHSAYSGRAFNNRRCIHQGISQVAFLSWKAPESHQKSIMDPTTEGRGYLHRRGNGRYRPSP
jgi:hypothetical protein